MGLMQQTPLAGSHTRLGFRHISEAQLSRAQSSPMALLTYFDMAFEHCEHYFPDFGIPIFFNSDFESSYRIGWILHCEEYKDKYRVNTSSRPESFNLKSIFERFLQDKTRSVKDIHKFFRYFADEVVSEIYTFLYAHSGLSARKEDFLEAHLARVVKLLETFINQIRDSLVINFAGSSNSFGLFLKESGVLASFRFRGPQELIEEAWEEAWEDAREEGNDPRATDLSGIDKDQETGHGFDTTREPRDHQFTTDDSQELVSSELIRKTPVSASKNASQQVTRKQRRRRVWKHLTISRDETSASAFYRQRLSILFFQRKLERHCLLGSPTETSEPPVVLPASFSQENESLRPNVSYPAGMNVTMQSNSEAEIQPRGSYKISSVAVPHVSRTKDTMSTITGSEHIQNESGKPNGTSEEYFRPAYAGVGKLLTQDPLPNSPAHHQRLLDRITSLELENQCLKTKETSSERWKIIHFLQDKEISSARSYFDKPVWAPGLKQQDYSLKATLPVTDVTGYIKKTGLDFVVMRHYSEKALIEEVRTALARQEAPPEPQHSNEHIVIASERLARAVERFLSKQPTFAKDFPKFNVRERIEAPYLFWYMYRSSGALECLTPPDMEPMRLLTAWIDSVYEEKYKLAKIHLNKGLVTLSTMPFLVKPGDAVVWKEKEDWNAAVARTLLVQTTPPILHWDKERTTWTEDFRENANVEKSTKFFTRWSFDSWSFHYDGEFLRKKTTRNIIFKAESLDEEIEIRKLNLYPLRFADEKVKSQLENRGKRFWSCRDRSFVSYQGDAGMYGVSISCWYL